MASERANCIQAFCKLRRLQEANHNGYCRCITCGAIVRWDECDGGHFHSRQFRGTEIDPDNVWPQCVECNRFGGSKTHDVYGVELEKKIGRQRMETLEVRKVSYVSHDYRRLTGKFLSMCKRIRKEKGL